MITKRLVSLAIAFMIALGAGVASAQTPSPPPPPPAYGAPITLEQAKKVMAGAEAEAKKNNWGMAITILDAGGHAVMMQRLDGTQLGSIDVAKDKAWSAVAFRRPTKAFEENLGKGFEFIYQMTLDGMIGSQGGVPLVVGGKLIGAIGCSGGTGPQDLQTCTAGLAALQ